MTLAILAECCSWTNLITTNNLYAVYEQGLWSLMFLLLGGCFCVKRFLDLYFNDLQSGIPTGLYFLVFLVSLTNVIYVSPLWNTKVRRRSSTNLLSISILLNILAIIAFAITWSLILDFFEQEADAMRDLPYEEFLNARSTFVKAYEEVTTTSGYY